MYGRLSWAPHWEGRGNTTPTTCHPATASCLIPPSLHCHPERSRGNRTGHPGTKPATNVPGLLRTDRTCLSDRGCTCPAYPPPTPPRAPTRDAPTRGYLRALVVLPRPIPRPTVGTGSESGMTILRRQDEECMGAGSGCSKTRGGVRWVSIRNPRQRKSIDRFPRRGYHSE